MLKNQVERTLSAIPRQADQKFIPRRRRRRYLINYNVA